MPADPLTGSDPGQKFNEVHVSAADWGVTDASSHLSQHCFWSDLLWWATILEAWNGVPIMQS